MGDWRGKDPSWAVLLKKKKKKKKKKSLKSTESWKCREEVKYMTVKTRTITDGASIRTRFNL